MKYTSQKGMSLVEMMIAIAVVLIGMEGFTLLFIKTWDTNKFILEEGLASTRAARATNNIIIALRGIQQADNGDFPIEAADDFDLTVYNDIDKDGVIERVHYYLDLDTDELYRGVTEPNTATTPISYPAGDQTITLVTNYVVNDTGDPIFVYYNDDYPGDTVTNPLVTPANTGDIQLVKVNLFVNINPVHAPDNIYIESFVDLRNLHNYE